MLDLRIYRAAFVPAVLALVVAAFSLQTRPRPITTALPPDAFDAPRAMQLLDGLAERFPDRRPGSEGDMALAGAVQRTFAATDFEVTTSDATGETIDGERTLRTVVAQRQGRLSRAIVLLAHRDAASAPARAELSGTATLMEIARLLSGRTTRRSIVLVSTSGGSGGGAGAAHWAETVKGPIDAVLVLGDMAGTRQRRPQVVPWSNALGVAPQRLQRTVEQALRTESGPPGSTQALMQALRLAFPLTVSEQGPILEAGLPAVLVSASGELGPGPNDPVGVGRLEAMGRTVLRTLTALDEGPDVRPSEPQAVVLVRNQMLPEWAVRVLVAALLLPPLVAGIDGLARVRRRRERILPWIGWTAALGSPLLAAGLVVLLLALLGALNAPAAPAPPGAIPVAAGALVAAVAAVALGFLAVWPLLRALAPASGDGGAGIAVALLAQALAWVVWAVNPYAALFLVPAVHLWLLAAAPEVRLRPGGRVLAVLAALVPFALAALAYGVALDADPLQLGWMGVLAIAGGHVSIPSLVLWSAIAGCGVAALVIAAHTAPARPAGPALGQVRSRGPLTYAGPGSLGGTESARRR